MRTIHPGGRLLISIIGALAMAIGVVASVSASSPQGVTIVSHGTFNPDGPNYGDFAATGSAVTSGALCASGTFVDTGLRVGGFQGRHGLVQIQVVKQFTCADSSGTFVVKLQIQANLDTGIESFTWVVMGGTGQYASLNGSGQGSTVPNPPIGNINTYFGFVVD